MIAAPLEQDLVDAGRSGLGCRMSVRDGPPELASRNAGLLEFSGDLVVQFGREEAQVRGGEHELRVSIVQHHHAVEDAVMHAGRLARSIAQEPLRRRWSDVDLYRSGAESSGRQHG